MPKATAGESKPYRGTTALDTQGCHVQHASTAAVTLMQHPATWQLRWGAGALAMRLRPLCERLLLSV